MLTLLAMVLAACAIADQASAMTGGITQNPEPGWAVRLDWKGQPDCTGALVAPSWVLTAGHCLLGSRARDFQVRFKGVSYTAAKLYKHPDYTSETRVHYPDIGLVKLPINAVAVAGATTVPIATAGDLEYFRGRGVSLFGYGKDASGKMSSVIRKSPDGAWQMTRYCQIKHNQCFLRADWAKNRTAVRGGDSGGPWMGWRDGGWHVLAVVSGYPSTDLGGIQSGTSPAEPSVARWIAGKIGPTAPPTPEPTPAEDPAPLPAPAPAADSPPPGPGPRSPSLHIEGSCDSSGGTLTGVSGGFTPGGTATIRAWYPDGRPYPNLISVSRVNSGGSISWTWPCAGDPAGTYTTEAIDNSTGTGTGRVAFAIGAAQPAPVTITQLIVDNRVTNGATAMREDTPAYLSTSTRNFCKRDGCALGGTDMGSGAVITAECTIGGDRTTNGQDNSAIDDGNPGLYTSTRWYGIHWGDGRFGYISEVWIRSDFRGGLGLRSC